ncbi:MAG: hypothetical protein ACI396_00400 [Acutalibacteraceae bacterium]
MPVEFGAIIWCDCFGGRQNEKIIKIIAIIMLVVGLCLPQFLRYFFYRFKSNAPCGSFTAERIFTFQRLAAAATAVVIATISVAEYEYQEDDDDPLAAAAVTKVKTTH